MKVFKIVILGIFGFFIIFAVLIFSGTIDIGSGGGSNVGGEVVVWGTIPQGILGVALEELRLEYQKTFTLRYVEKRGDSFDQELIEALASGVGPDMILLPQDLIVRHSDKIFPIPYESFSVRDFKDTFIEEGELYFWEDGILALPFSIDPLVMYWNRDLFTTAGITFPPEFWDELYILTPKLTLKDDTLNIIKSAIALGEYKNIEHAKDILALLILQAGDNIVEREEGRLVSVLGTSQDFVVPPVESALRFYTEFSNPTKPFYSWNKALQNDKDNFISGDLAMYLGYASEYAEIKQKSPHLNFDIVFVPQARDAKRKTTFGRMMGVGILKSSKNIPTAYFSSFLLSGEQFLRSYARASALPSVRRDILNEATTAIFGEIFNRSALVSRAWLDPNPSVTGIIFQGMIEDVVSGRARLNQVVTKSQKELKELLKN